MLVAASLAQGCMLAGPFASGFERKACSWAEIDHPGDSGLPMAPDPSLAGDQSVNANQAMPDVATESRTRIGGTLDKVGMTQIEVPVRLRDDDGVLFLCP